MNYLNSETGNNCIKTNGGGTDHKPNRALMTPILSKTKLVDTTITAAGDFINFKINNFPNPATFSFFVKIMGLDYSLKAAGADPLSYELETSIIIFSYGTNLRLIYNNDKTSTYYDYLELTVITSLTPPEVVVGRIKNFSKYFGIYCHIGLSYDDPALSHYPIKMNFEVQQQTVPILITDSTTPNTDVLKATAIIFNELAVSNRVFGLWSQLRIYQNYSGFHQ